VSLIETFLAQVEARPEAAAIISPRGETLTYGQLAQRSAARARAWAGAGVGEGDVVLVAHSVSIGLYEALLATFRLGAVAMFPEPAAGLKGLGQAIDAARPKALAAGPLAKWLRWLSPQARRLPLLPEPGVDVGGDGPVAPVGGNAPALITFTSGSTGRPKGIVRSVDFLMLQHRLLEQLRRTQPDDVDLISLPVFILSNLAAGAASVIPQGRLTRPARLDGSALRMQIAEHRVNRIIAPPAVAGRIVEGGAPLKHLEAVFTGGGPVFPNLLRAIQRFAPRSAVHAVYGSTEAEPIAHLEMKQIAEADWSAMAAGAGLLAGRPVREIAVELRDHEIFVSGPHVNRGYLDPADDRTTKSMREGRLWHRTGDAGRFDEAGRLWLLGRREAASGGLFPFAVETAALSWPGVRQAALLAEAGGAVLAVAGERLDEADLRRRSAALGNVRLVVVGAVPMDARHNSKVDYRRLRKMLA
jgi:olefin beta-lactone synthetase